jgi:hypothetical protein
LIAQGAPIFKDKLDPSPLAIPGWRMVVTARQTTGHERQRLATGVNGWQQPYVT